MKSLDNEKYVLDSFQIGAEFELWGKRWKVMNAGKPRTQGGSGEPKTDVYVFIVSEPLYMGRSEGKELKISIKRSNYNFVENKLSMPRLADIMGEEIARDAIGKGICKLIRENTEELSKDMVVKENVVRKKGEEPCTQYKLGWRLDMTNKPNGKRSFLFPLTNKQKKEMLTGECLDARKRDAVVNGKVIKDSGVANCFLEMDLDRPMTPQAIIDKLEVITDDFVEKHQFDIYGTIKAVNYFSNGKYEHARPLVMFVEYEKMWDGSMRPTIQFDPETTLQVNSTDRAKVLKEII